MQNLEGFQRRHIGINRDELDEMLSEIGVSDLDELLKLTIPDDIFIKEDLDIKEAMTEYEFLNHMRKIAAENKVYHSFIGQGYYDTITPSVILRNVFENPGWYTQYTPYQAEIAQGRLEALLNFQTVVSDLTALPIANASLLDEGTAAAEAMAMFADIRNKKRKKNPATKFFVDNAVFEQTKAVMETRSKPLDIEIVYGDYQNIELDDDFIGCLLQYPNSHGRVEDYRAFVEQAKGRDILIAVAADIMSLALLTPPGEWGADAVVGNTQRFGVPMGYGGPHAAYFATREEYKRLIPGRIIGVSVDRLGNRAFRMALQTREQHIKREKATSNICTAQALLAIMAGMYAVYHGPSGIKYIAEKIHRHATLINDNLAALGYETTNKFFFDTIAVKVTHDQAQGIRKSAEAAGINLFYGEGHILISVGETCNQEIVRQLLDAFAENIEGETQYDLDSSRIAIQEDLQRTSEILSHEVFHTYHTESKMMRYLKSLENKDLSLVHSMISLGSCTMKLNAASEMIPVSWPEFAHIHPFAPADQTKGYERIIRELSQDLCTLTGFTACSLQPNSGAQGEFTGLMTIAAYHQDRGENHRKIALIPSSAHGTNPASAVMAGMDVVVVKCDDNGNIDVDDLRAKAEAYKDTLAALMVTYPSTHGVFETAIVEICDIIHDNGGLVYMDGANMNAQVGFTNPGVIGADVCHLNLHKTFAIPHGGGGPGMGPICVNDKLAPYLPGHRLQKTGGDKAISAVSAAPYGSASILLISYGYIKMLGKAGMANATRYAILNANYIRSVLDDHYEILYTGERGMCAHELIVDLRPFKAAGIQAEDVAKRLMDYSFHAPTLSFPVPGTIMIEPTESEDKAELDRFCEALIEIRKEIDAVARGDQSTEDNVLVNAPHTVHEVTADEWKHAYSREEAAYPVPYLRSAGKFWCAVARVDSAYGDRNLMCTCPPIEEYMS